jgi:MFS family permease
MRGASEMKLYDSAEEDNFSVEREEGIDPWDGDPLLVVEKEEGAPPTRFGRYVDLVRNVLTWRFAVFLVFSQFVGKGMLFRLAHKAMLPLFKTALHVDPLTMQLCTMVVMLPWSVKPVLGLLSDFVLLGGYHKRYWLLLSALVGCAGALGLLVTHTLGVAWCVVCLLGIQLQVAMYDLLSEGKYSEVRNAHPETGSSITTLAQGMQTVGALVTIAYVGVLADGAHYTVIFALCLGMGVSMWPPTLLGWLPEEQCAPGTLLLKWAHPERMRREWRTILVVAMCGLSSVVCGLLATLASPLAALCVSILLLGVILAGCWAVFPARMTDVALYLVLVSLGAPSIGSALDYFYTATPECLADGPHFSFTYYITWAGTVGTVVSLLGVLLYEALLSRKRFRPVLFLTTLLGAVGGLGDLVLVLRLGVNDHVAYMVGQAVVEPLVGTLRWIPASALIVMAAPPGMEASAFAFMAGLSNFASMVSELCGVLLFTYAGIEPCNFDSLWWLVLLCHICMPLVVGLAAVWLVPNVEQTAS